MIIVDFYCPKCGEIKDEELIKNSKEKVICKCGIEMIRKFTNTKYIYKKKETPVTPEMLGGGNKARFTKGKQQ